MTYLVLLKLEQYHHLLVQILNYCVDVYLYTLEWTLLFVCQLLECSNTKSQIDFVVHLVTIEVLIEAFGVGLTLVVVFVFDDFPCLYHQTSWDYCD